MMRRGWIVAIVLVAVVNGIVLLGVARNRAGEPDAIVVLTERELPLGYTPDENTGILLRLEWTRDWEGPDWLDTDKLAELGFDCSAPVDAAATELHYDKQLNRRVFAVLEFEGDVWERWLETRRREIADTAEEVERGEASEQEVERLRQSLASELETRSRLDVIDAGTNPEALRKRYSDRSRFIIAPAVVDLYVSSYSADDTVPPTLQGRITEITVPRIHVSREHRAVFEPFLGATGPYQGPRYRVNVAFGSRYEPWIVEAEAIVGATER